MRALQLTYNSAFTYVMVFQGSQMLVHKLHDKQLETFRLFYCFVKAEYITKVTPKTMGVMVLQEKMLLSAREMYVVWEADGFRTMNPNNALLKSFMEQVTKAYTTSALYMQKKLPLQSHTLRSLSVLDTVLRGHSQAAIQLKKLSAMLGHLSPASSDLHQEIM